MKKIRFVITLCHLLVYSALRGQCTLSDLPSTNFSCSTAGSQSFTPTESFVATVEIWGGGGGGDNGNNNQEGGGGGGYATATYTFFAGTTYCVTIGSGGGNGQSGENSQIREASTALCSGGTLVFEGEGGGAGGNAMSRVGGGATAPVGGTTIAGGNGGNDDNNGGGSQSGGGGGGGGSGPGATNGDNGNGNLGGDGGEGSGLIDSGGDGGTDVNGQRFGANGTIPGGGGGGGADNQNGNHSGNGANGQINISVLTILPVELVSFDLTRSDQQIRLHWQTASEVNNEKFIIERSVDGTKFETIGEVQGAGTSERFQDYSFIDEMPMPGLNYYRLKQLDYDGTFQLSQIRFLSFSEGLETASIFPTRTSGEVSITLKEQSKLQDIKLFNLEGHHIQGFHFEDSDQVSIDLSPLPAGIYFIMIETDHSKTVHRIIRS